MSGCELPLAEHNVSVGRYAKGYSPNPTPKIRVEYSSQTVIVQIEAIRQNVLLFLSHHDAQLLAKMLTTPIEQPIA